MKQFIFLTAIFLVLFASCKKDKDITYNIPCSNPTNDATISSSLIIGRWKWVSEYFCTRGFPCVFKTPVTEGYTMDLIFDNNSLKAYKNGLETEKYQYGFAPEKTYTLYPLDTITVLEFKNFQTGVHSGYVHFKVCNDTLTLNYQVWSDTHGQEKWAKY